MTDHKQIFRLEEVKELTGLSRSSIYAYMQTGSFPKAKKLGPRAVGWLKGDLYEWLESRV